MPLRATPPRLGLACLLFGHLLPAADQNWSTYLGDPGSTHASTLAEITPDNVSRLRPAWTWRAGEALTPTSQIQCNPLIIDGVLYGTTPQLNVVALDAATGRELWRFRPAQLTFEKAHGVNRGLTWWTDGREKRLFLASGRWLHALNPENGLPIPSFGQGGRIDLTTQLGRDIQGLEFSANTPGAIFDDLIILGMRLGEGPAPAAPGPIRAYNVRTGDLVWTFHTIPQPGEPGHETWPPDAYQRVGGANVWAGMTVDVERGLVYCPVGSAAFDFWGGHRLGENLFANCLLALDARTGQRRWHFQLVHHDLWDRDPPAPPVLFTWRGHGQAIPAIAQTTKQGYVFVFNRETGEPLFPIDEIPVPTSDLLGEVTHPTQPRPRQPAPFARQTLSAEELTQRTPEAYRAALEQFIRVRPHSSFTPPSREGTIIFPGFDGGAEWGGPAVSPDGILYVNANEMPWILTLVETSGAKSTGEQVYRQNCTGCHGPERKGNLVQGVPSLLGLRERMTPGEISLVVQHGRRVMPAFGFLPEAQRSALVDYLLDRASEAAPSHTADVTAPPYTHTGYNRWLDADGYPAVRPPWGTLNAINLHTGATLWQVPLGEYPALTAQGMPLTGTENYGGPVVTAGQVLFIAATKDERIRAFDRHTGRQLWEHSLPAGGYATPSVYQAGGRQYVVIACGGGKMGTPPGDAYVAFALPEGP